MSVDNPPILDLNGPMVPGRNYSTVYLENSEPVFVSLTVNINVKAMSTVGMC